eukprot:SAG25_NODE_1445_length_3002_cov_5.130899_3_plen_278_part_00
METDSDCGGGYCRAMGRQCGVSQRCAENADCTTQACAGGVCFSCSDQSQNGDETDVDCGGSTCPRCAIAQACTSDGDCAGAAVCIAQQCATFHNISIQRAAGGTVPSVSGGVIVGKLFINGGIQCHIVAEVSASSGVRLSLPNAAVADPACASMTALAVSNATWRITGPARCVSARISQVQLTTGCETQWQLNDQVQSTVTAEIVSTANATCRISSQAISQRQLTVTLTGRPAVSARGTVVLVGSAPCPDVSNPHLTLPHSCRNHPAQDCALLALSA